MMYKKIKKRKEKEMMTELERKSNRVNAYLSIIGIKQQDMKERLLKDVEDGKATDNLEFIFDYLSLISMYKEVIDILTCS